MWVSRAQCPALPLIRPALPGTFSRKREKDAPSTSRPSCVIRRLPWAAFRRSFPIGHRPGGGNIALTRRTIIGATGAVRGRRRRRGCRARRNGSDGEAAEDACRERHAPAPATAVAVPAATMSVALGEGRCRGDHGRSSECQSDKTASSEPTQCRVHELYSFCQGTRNVGRGNARLIFIVQFNGFRA